MSKSLQQVTHLLQEIKQKTHEGAVLTHLLRGEYTCKLAYFLAKCALAPSLFKRIDMGIYQRKFNEFTKMQREDPKA